MRKEARLLLNKAINSLLLAIEHFNRPWDRGRAEAVLIMLDHAFEMLFKAAILHRGGRIREPKAKQTIGFDACVRKALSEGQIRFLTDEQAITVQMINALRDAAQHHLLEISEPQLYFHAQAGVTLFADLLDGVFERKLAEVLPDRVLPVSTRPPTDLDLFIKSEVDEIRRLLEPGRRRRVEASARARSLAIMEGAVQGDRTQPGPGDLNRLLRLISQGKSCELIFPGVSALRLSVEGEGLSFQLRITKKEDAPPFQLVPEGTTGVAVLAVRRVDELGFYSLGRDKVAEKVGLTGPKTSAVIYALRLQENSEYFKEIQIEKSRFKRYSIKAVEKIQETLPSLNLDKVWQDYRFRNKRSNKQKMQA